MASTVMQVAVDPEASWTTVSKRAVLENGRKQICWVKIQHKIKLGWLEIGKG